MEEKQFLDDAGLARLWEHIIAKITAFGVPAVTTSDNGKFLRVVGGTWTASTISNAEEASF